MGMTSVHFEIPEEILYTLNESIAEFTSQVRLFTALQLFSRHKLSLGKAAEVAGLARTCTIRSRKPSTPTMKSTSRLFPTASAQ